MPRLDIKYRPKKFTDVLGNDGVKKLLLARSQAGTLAEQSMMFAGPKGSGKTTLAKLVARSIACECKVDGEPCGECNRCVSILDGTSNIVEEFDAASQGTVDRIREIVKDSEYESFDGVQCIYILDEAQRLTPQAQDAMLKAVEDRSIMVILCTTEPHKIKGPIRSRVEEYPVNNPTSDSIVARMSSICDVEGIKYEKEALLILARMLQNCPRTCIRAIETISVTDDVTAKSVKQFLRFDSYNLIDGILLNIDNAPLVALSKFDELSSIESPMWIRDTILLAISSGLRVDVGSSSNYPIPITFFKTRVGAWSNLARQLVFVEKPTTSGLLALLLNRSSVSTVTTKVDETFTKSDVIIGGVKSTIVENVARPIVENVKKQEIQSSLIEKTHKNIEVDGIKFTQDENLTTLDDKIHQSVGTVNNVSDEVLGVEYDKNKIPLTDREFARGVINRIKGTNRQ